MTTRIGARARGAMRLKLVAAACLVAVALGAIPQMEADAAFNVDLLSGEPPSPLYIPSGCAFHPRCPHAMAVCRSEPPPAPRNSAGTMVACHLYEEERV